MRSSISFGAWLGPVVAAAATGCCPEAFADATYRLELSGQAVHQLNCWEDPNFCIPVPPKDQVYAWTGYVDLTVASAGDGTFSDPSLLSVDFVSNLGGFAVPSDSPPPSPYRLWPFSGSVTIAAGKVTSFDGSNDYWGMGPLLSFGGMSAQYHDPGGHHTGPTDAIGTLVMVPEPATWLLLLSGVPFLARYRGGRSMWLPASS